MVTLKGGPVYSLRDTELSSHVHLHVELFTHVWRTLLAVRALDLCTAHFTRQRRNLLMKGGCELINDSRHSQM
jgi:hypothetical protein